jgi:hypothetical protein
MTQWNLKRQYSSCCWQLKKLDAKLKQNREKTKLIQTELVCEALRLLKIVTQSKIDGSATKKS